MTFWVLEKKGMPPDNPFARVTTLGGALERNSLAWHRSAKSGDPWRNSCIFQDLRF
jgi:hypothetical protein